MVDRCLLGLALLPLLGCERHEDLKQQHGELSVSYRASWTTLSPFRHYSPMTINAGPKTWTPTVATRLAQHEDMLALYLGGVNFKDGNAGPRQLLMFSERTGKIAVPDASCGPTTATPLGAAIGFWNQGIGGKSTTESFEQYGVIMRDDVPGRGSERVVTAFSVKDGVLHCANYGIVPAYPFLAYVEPLRAGGALAGACPDDSQDLRKCVHTALMENAPGRVVTEAEVVQLRGAPPRLCAPRAEWKTYVSSKHHLQIEYPHDCFAEASEDDNGVVLRGADDVPFMQGEAAFVRVVFARDDGPFGLLADKVRAASVQALQSANWQATPVTREHGDEEYRVQTKSGAAQVSFSCLLSGGGRVSDPRIDVCKQILASARGIK